MQYLNTFTQKANKHDEHHQVSGEIAVRLRANASKLRVCMELHRAGNPFPLKSPLKNLASMMMSVKEHLSSTKTERSLKTMFALSLLEYYSDKSNFKMFVAYDNTIKGHDLFTLGGKHIAC